MTSGNGNLVCVVGAGMSGSLTAIELARRGFEVEVYELRGDIRKGFVGPSRSLNMTLSRRGLAVLERADLLPAVMPLTVPVRGRIVHGLDGSRRFFPYGRSGEEILHAIARNDLNSALMTAAEGRSNIRFHFRKSFLRLDPESGTVFFRDLDTQRSVTTKSDLVIGADGSFSAVRQALHRGKRADYQQKFLSWDYKELKIPAASGGSYRMEPHALHVWPRGDCMLMALPNRDGSFNCICTMPAEGPARAAANGSSPSTAPWREGARPSFAALSTDEAVRALFAARFPDVVPLLPTLERDFERHPTSTFATVQTSPWHDGQRVVLVGDACHTVVPFFGQGMIAGFEDCAALADSLDRHHENRGAAFAAYESARKRNTDALAALSIHNFVELRDKIRDPQVIARKGCEGLLARFFPRRWVPIYTLIAHTTLPYAEALARYNRQRRIARWLGFDLAVAAWAWMIRGGRLLERRRAPRPGPLEQDPRAPAVTTTPPTAHLS